MGDQEGWHLVMACLEYSNCLSFHGFLLLPLLKEPSGDVFF